MANPSSIGVIFDCDGTLINSLGVWFQLEEYLANQSPLPLSDVQRRSLGAMTLPECAHFFHEVGGLGKTPQEVTEIMDEFMLAYYRTEATALPGALDFVRELAEAGVRLSVASSSSPAYLEAGLARCGFTPYLEAIVSVDEVGASKRTPEVWERAQMLMGTQKKNTWGVEDSAYAIQTLARAGYRTIGVCECDESGSFEDLSRLSDHVILSFSELSAAKFLSWCD